MYSASRILSQTDRLTLRGEPIHGKLSLQLQILKKSKQEKASRVVRKFKKLILLGKNQKLRDHFNNIMSLLQYMKKPQNYEINQKEGTITLLHQGKLIDTIVLNQIELPYEVSNQENQRIVQSIISKSQNDNAQSWVNQFQERSFIEDEESCLNNQNNDESYYQSNFKDNKNNYFSNKRSDNNNFDLRQEQRIEELQRDLIDIKQQLKHKDNTINKLMTKLTQLEKLIKSNHIQVNYYINQINQKMTQMAQTKQQVQIQDIKQQQPQIVPACDWIEKNSYFARFINTEENKIRVISSQNVSVFGRKQKKLSYKIIVQAKKIKKYIGLGLVDSAYQNSPDVLSKNNIVMLENSGKFYFNGKCLKREDVAKILIREGDKFSMQVDQAQQKIQWKLESQRLLLIQKCSFFQDQIIQWVPFIHFSCKGDQIQFLSN